MKQVIRKAIKEAHGIENEKPNIFTLLLDGNSIMKRALVNKKLNGNGEEYGMVLQSLITIKQVITQRDFNHCYFLCDGDGSGQLRAYIYPEYKANRDKNYKTAPQSDYDKAINDYCKKVIAYHNNKKVEVKRGETDDEAFQRQRSILIDILENLFVRTAIFDDVEGDDLIAYYIKNRQPNEKIIIVSGDRDLTQLISDDVMVYVLDMKEFIHKGNHTKKMGYPPENVLIKKMLCGDTSDNIKGIKGIGEKTFFDLFPSARERQITLDEVLTTAKEINEQRALKKQKPLKSCTNILNSVTDGSQGERIYEINKKIIDLSEPLMTDEAKEGMDAYIGAPLDPSDREFKNVYEIIVGNGMTELLDESKFGNFFSTFGKLIDNEKKLSN